MRIAVLSGGGIVALAGAAALWGGGEPRTNVPHPPRSFAVSRAVAAPAARDSREFPGEYRILHARTLFSASPSGGTESPHPAAAPLYALRGVMQDGGQLTAFLEDTSSSRIISVRAGDRVGAGRIDDVTLQAVTFRAEGQERRVAVGESLGDSTRVASDAGATPVAGVDPAERR